MAIQLQSSRSYALARFLTISLLHLFPSQESSAQESPPAPSREVRTVYDTSPLLPLREAEQQRATKYYRYWFRGSLAASYAVPLVGWSVFALGVHGDWYTVPALIGLVGLSVPLIVHIANGDGVGAIHAFFGMLLSVGVGMLAGYTTGQLAPSSTARGDPVARDAMMLGLAGYVGWAVIDVAFFAYHDEPK